MLTYTEQISQEISSWDGVHVTPHRFGGIEFKLDKAEIGHIHRNNLVDIPFPMKIRDQLLTEGLVSKHHVLPDSGWISFRVRSDGGVRHAIWLLKLSYLQYLLRRKNRSLAANDQSIKTSSEDLKALNLSPELAMALEQAVDISQQKNSVE